MVYLPIGLQAPSLLEPPPQHAARFQEIRENSASKGEIRPLKQNEIVEDLLKKRQGSNALHIGESIQSLPRYSKHTSILNFGSLLPKPRYFLSECSR